MYWHDQQYYDNKSQINFCAINKQGKKDEVVHWCLQWLDFILNFLEAIIVLQIICRRTTWYKQNLKEECQETKSEFEKKQLSFCIQVISWDSAVSSFELADTSSIAFSFWRSSISISASSSSYIITKIDTIKFVRRLWLEQNISQYTWTSCSIFLEKKSKYDWTEVREERTCANLQVSN